MAEKKKKSGLRLIAAAAFGGAKVVGGATRDAIDAVATNVEQNPDKMSLDFGGGAPVKKRKKPAKKKAAPKKKAPTGTRRKVKSKDKKVAELEAEIKRLRGTKTPTTTKKKSVRRVQKKEKPKKAEQKERTEFVTATGVYTKKNGKVTFKPYK